MPEKSKGAVGIVDAAESGDRLATLIALRLHIAERLEDGVPARDLAALSLRLMRVTEEIDALAGDGRSDPEDELARRRAVVLSAAGVDGPAEGGDARASGG